MNDSDIGSYPEHNFQKYWKRILSDPQFIGTLARFSRTREFKDQIRRNMTSGGMGAMLKKGGSVFRTAVSRMNELRSWVDFQRFMVFLVNQLIERTTEGFSVSGLPASAEDFAGGTIFLSSHRSTSLDPIMANYVLRSHFGRTAYNAVGDNIFRTPWLGHLIRLNRGFIVKRTVEDLEEKLREAEKLSQYINDLLAKDSWVWLAHRNGRAKDGRDSTDSAVLAMLKMANPESSWADYSQATNLVPLAMSWEVIPLDDHMAMELNGLTAHKGNHRDMMNILTEIRMNKKRVHLHFGNPLRAEKRSGLVKGLDSQIHLGTRLWEANWLAYRNLLDPKDAADLEVSLAGRVDLDSAAWLEDRIEKIVADISEKLASGTYQLPDDAESADGLLSGIRRSLWQMYAAPVGSALAAADVSEVLSIQERLRESGSAS